MIVNYDEDNGWSSILDIFSNKNTSGSTISDEVKNLFNMVDSESKLKVFLEDTYSATQVTDEAFKSWIATLDDTAIKTMTAGDALSAYQAHLNTASASTSKFASFTAKAGSVLKSVGSVIGSTLLNFGIGMAIGVGISAIATAIDNVIHKNEKLIEAGEEAQSSIDEAFSSFSKGKSSLNDLGKSFSDNADQITSTGDAIDSIAQKYTELKKGVDNLSNSNKSLSNEDYQDYLDISNQLAEQFPSLVSGYDAQGNAILNLGNNASTAASQLTELYNASMLSANVEIGNNLNDRFSGVQTQIQEYQKEIDTWEKELKSSNKQIEGLSFSADEIMSGDIEYLDGMEEEIDAVLKKFDLSSRKYYVDDGLGGTTPMINTRGISEEAAKALADVFTINNTELEKKIATNKQLIQSQWDSMADSIGQYIQTSSSFSELDSTLQDAFLSNIREIDATGISEDYGGDVTKFIYSEILDPLSGMKPEAQQALADLIQFDPSNLNIDEYSDLVSKALINAFPDDSAIQDQMRKTFGFEKAIDEAEKQAKALKDVLGKDFSDAIDSMSLDELEKGYDLVINGDEAISTVDELRTKIEQAQALAATSVDLDVHTNMDAISEALESANAGADYENAVTYLEKAKELFDQGLVGTDDFKSIAAYLSPTGSDDPVNFAENYGKALRYLTEDGQGVQNFLNDLASKGYANFETLSDGTQQWTYDIEDLEDAATNMGIGFEFMMDMFGRLEDYGFSNNFVGSVEDGTQRISELSQELVEAEAKLAELEASGADQTAIDQQREKVQGLRNDLLETQDALSQLITRSADEYAEQVETARQSITALGEERKRILSENSYGEDTQAVADLMEQQMRQWADENGLELDADLNIKQPETPPEIEVDAKANLEIDPNSEDTFKNNPTVTVTFKADVDGEELDVNKFTDQEGTIHYTTNINDVEVELDKVENKDGTITYEANFDKTLENLDVEATVNYLIGDQQEPEVKQAFVDYIKNHQDDPDFRTAFVDYIKSGQDDPDAKSALLDYILSDQEDPIDGKTADMYYNSIGQDAPQDKTAGVWYTIKGVIGNIADFITGGSGLSGTAHVSGTVGGLYPIPQLSGRALAMGTLQDESILNPNWRTKHSEVALTGEEGPELVVTRANRWFTVGDHGAEFAKIPQGSVIFNASQTRELFEKGRINSRGTAMITGTAYAGGSGGGSFFGGGSGSSSGMSGASTSSGSSSNNTSSSNNSSSTQEAAEEFEEAVDWIEIAIDRLERAIDTLDLKASSVYRSWSERNQSLASEISEVSKEIDIQQQGYNRYLQQANSVGLSSDWASRVQNGTIDISTITDEDLADKIKDYQSWLISGHVIYFIAGTSPKPCFATT